ncbi:MAG: DUF2058 domain-containing protein [Gammaproteobacteria bacterium]|nr:DUF2058 domain-containing protein [Gammaproteobacteria bacterium]
MTNSLQDQLLKAGLVKKSQVNKANKAKHKKARQRNARNAEADDKAILAQQMRQQKIARDRDLNRDIVAKQQRKAAVAEIQQLLELHAVTDTEGEVAFNFQHKRKIKQLNVSKNTHASLVAGQLAIVHFDGRYRLISAELLDKIRQRDANCFTFLSSPGTVGGPEDEYAGYEVPDDLTW